MSEPTSENEGIPAPPKPQYYPNFAVATAVVAGLVGVWIVLAGHLFSGTFGLSDQSWKSLSGGGQLAARLIAPASVLGVVLILVGAWMAVVEWRGGFADKAPGTAAGRKTLGVPDIPGIIGAVGKLRGAALLIVVGALLMALSAWVAQSVSDNVRDKPAQMIPGKFVNPKHMPQLPQGPKRPLPTRTS